jgi:hypothetical protein
MQETVLTPTISDPEAICNTSFLKSLLNHNTLILPSLPSGTGDWP